MPPRYPAEVIERSQDGWVELRFTVTPEGTTSNIRVVGKRPSLKSQWISLVGHIALAHRNCTVVEFQALES